MAKLLYPQGRGYLQSSALFEVVEAWVFRIWFPKLRKLQVRSLVSEHFACLVDVLLSASNVRRRPVASGKKPAVVVIIRPQK